MSRSYTANNAGHINDNLIVTIMVALFNKESNGTCRNHQKRGALPPLPLAEELGLETPFLHKHGRSGPIMTQTCPRSVERFCCDLELGR